MSSQKTADKDAAIRAVRARLARKRLLALYREWVAQGRPRR